MQPAGGARACGGRGRGLAPLAVVLAALGAGACAQETAPVGGRPDPIPPRVVRVSPDSGAVNVRPGDIEFRFDEVISERPAGAPSLEALFLISPRDGDARVRWRRDALTVRPRQGWRPNTTYRVTMLPGVQDLRNNRMDSATVVVFSTGGEISETRIRGVVFDWAAGQPLPNALVYGITRPDVEATDSVLYVARADAQGRFELPHVPRGEVTVVGIQDANNDFGIDAREAWDSTRVALGDSVRVELYAFVQDTVGPIIADATLIDSVTVRLTTSQPLSLAAPITVEQFSVFDPDSQPVRVTSALTRAAYDSAAARRDSAPAAVDTARADSVARDTAAVPVPAPVRGAPVRGGAIDTIASPPPRPSRPIPATEIVLRLATPVRPGARYTIEARGLRNLLDRPRDSRQVLTVPEPPPPAPAPPADTTTPPPPPRVAGRR